MRRRPTWGRVALWGVLVLAGTAVACGRSGESGGDALSGTATVREVEEDATGSEGDTRSTSSVPDTAGPSGTGTGARGATGSTAEAEDTTSPDAGVETLPDGSFVCRPAGSGPFPAVLYNHGGKGAAVGGDLKGTCRALADAGYMARSEKRPATASLAGHLDDVLEALKALRARDDVDPDRVGVMGFSRGGLLTLQAALARPDDIRVAVLLAPAPGNNSLVETLLDVSALTAPVHVYVAENDLVQADHVQLAHDVEAALTAAGKAVTLTIYGPYGRDGHMLFDEVQEPYWSDVLAVFDAALGSP